MKIKKTLKDKKKILWKLNILFMIWYYWTHTILFALNKKFFLTSFLISYWWNTDIRQNWYQRKVYSSWINTISYMEPTKGVFNSALIMTFMWSLSSYVISWSLWSWGYVITWPLRGATWSLWSYVITVELRDHCGATWSL